MAKALGSEIKEFYENHFPEGCYHEPPLSRYEDVKIDDLNPDQEYDLRIFGDIVPETGNGLDTVRSFSSVFLKWKKTQTHETFLVTVPKELVAKAKADIKALGYSVS